MIMIILKNDNFLRFLLSLSLLMAGGVLLFSLIYINAIPNFSEKNIDFQKIMFLKKKTGKARIEGRTPQKNLTLTSDKDLGSHVLQ